MTNLLFAFKAKKMPTTGRDIKEEILEIIFLMRRDTKVDNGVSSGDVQFFCFEKSHFHDLTCLDD